MGIRGFALIAAVALSGPALAGDEPGHRATYGCITFEVYCAACHGYSGKGDGTMAQRLRTPAADLTTMSLNNGGVFPAERVRATIAGGAATPPHDAAMPAWGPRFLIDFQRWTFDTREDDRALLERRIGDLVAFLATIQQ